MEGLELLQDMAMVMLVAGIVAVVFHRFRQPAVLGYLVAGVIVGLHALLGGALVTNHQSIRTLANLGVILLMFSLGLTFSFRKLAKVGRAAAIAAPIEITLMLLVGYTAGRVLGWEREQCVFLGAILSISSTTIVIKVLGEMGLSKETFASLIFGILIVEDLLAIAMLAVLSGMATTGALSVGAVAGTVGHLAVFLAVVVVAGLLVVPPLLGWVARTKSSEALLIVGLGLCFGVSLAAAQMGYSVALGAFLIGAVVAETRQGAQLSSQIEPVRDMFIAIFFVAAGMQIDPRMLGAHWGAILFITVALVVGKIVGCTTGTFLAGQPPRVALRVGMSMAQIGEFSFVLAGLVPHRAELLYQVAAGVSAITALTTPRRIRLSDGVVKWFERSAPANVLAYLNLYGQWMNRPGRQVARGSDQVRRLLRRWTLQIGLNLVLVSALFITAAWFGAGVGVKWGKSLPQVPGGGRPTVWLLAAILALPLLIATLRKLRAAAMVLAELSVPRAAAGQQTATARKVVANTILGAGSTGILLWILILSSAILPPWYVLIGLLAVVAGVALLMWQSFVKLYARAQIALHETLAAGHAVHLEAAKREAMGEGVGGVTTAGLPPMLREAVLRTVVVGARSPGDGKLIRELALRTATGASVVGIERDGTSVINPGPDEELRAGDRVLLIGSEKQLEAARPLLEGGGSSTNLHPARIGREEGKR